VHQGHHELVEGMAGWLHDLGNQGLRQDLLAETHVVCKVENGTEISEFDRAVFYF
jgi:hypothetical protein